MKKVLAAAVIAVIYVGMKVVSVWDDISMIGEVDPYE